jgi:16S rRNA (cytosine1402-N4)-methyltransferase
MEPGLKVTAADLINGLNKGELDELFKKLGDEDDSRLIAESICRCRLRGPILTTSQLAKLIVEAKVDRKRSGWLHPATKCFQALRIAVNDELNSLREALPQALEVLEPEGRLAVISFHSGEDKIVKEFMRNNESLRLVTKKPVRPHPAEVAVNPASRSARLRVAER